MNNIAPIRLGHEFFGFCDIHHIKKSIGKATQPPRASDCTEMYTAARQPKILKINTGKGSRLSQLILNKERKPSTKAKSPKWMLLTKYKLLASQFGQAIIAANSAESAPKGRPY